ncbi:MAG: adenylate/guanylate cyclase domain-containing protein [Deltaproteobacteria bacterium]|nr:adenylate/guanylate cyclase domain-containing protein [Deltaproteobacteria bacterium]
MGKKFLYAVLLVVLIAAGVEVACREEWLKRAEDRYYDLWHQLAGRRYEPRHVAIVAIDDQTRLEHQDEPLVFWSPHHAQVIKVLREAGVRVIGLDFIFVVSAEAWLKKLKLPESHLSRTYDLSFREQLAAGKVILGGEWAVDAQGNIKLLLPPPDYWASLPGQTNDVGLVRLYTDPDGVNRSFLPAFPWGGEERWTTFAQLLAARAAGKEPPEELEPPSPIAFAGPPGTIPRVSYQHLLSGTPQDPQIQALKDKVVIIGYEPSEVQDIHQTPYARPMSGPEIHANIVETILTGRSPQTVAAPLRWVYLAVVLSLGVALFFRLSPAAGLAALGLLGLSAAVFSYFLFRGNWLLPAAAPQLGLLLGYLGILGLRLTGEEKERARLRQIFGRYVSEEVVEKVLSSGKQPDLGGEAFTVTVLFSDIRNFTGMSESLSPNEVVEMLNTYFSRACEPILEQGGMVDKFVGDAVMAVFGAPAPQPDHARRAVAAALAMMEKAREFQAWMEQRFPDRGFNNFRIGIGLHTGEAVIGNIGTPKRFEFTAIGDTVNTASRLEGLTKELGWSIVASDRTVKAAGPGAVTGGRQELLVKGRQEPVVVLEVKGLEE